MDNLEVEVKVEEEIKEEKVRKKRGWLGLPIFSWVFFGIAAFALIIMLTYIISEDFANFYNRYPAAFLRGLFAAVTSVIPCSVAEAFIIFAPVLMVAIIIYANKKFTASWREVGKFLLMQRNR